MALVTAVCPSEPHRRREGRTSSKLEPIWSAPAAMITAAITGAESADAYQALITWDPRLVSMTMRVT